MPVSSFYQEPALSGVPGQVTGTVHLDGVRDVTIQVLDLPPTMGRWRIEAEVDTPLHYSLVCEIGPGKPEVIFLPGFLNIVQFRCMEAGVPPRVIVAGRLLSA